MTRCRPIRQDRTPARRRARDGCVPLPPSCRPARPTPRRERGDRRAAAPRSRRRDACEVDPQPERAGKPFARCERLDVTWSVREAARSRSAAATNSDSGSRSPARTSVATGPDGRRAHERVRPEFTPRDDVDRDALRRRLHDRAIFGALVRASRSKTGQPGPQPDIARRCVVGLESPICSTASGMDRDARSSSESLASSARFSARVESVRWATIAR